MYNACATAEVGHWSITSPFFSFFYFLFPYKHPPSLERLDVRFLLFRCLTTYRLGNGFLFANPANPGSTIVPRQLGNPLRFARYARDLLRARPRRRGTGRLDSPFLQGGTSLLFTLYSSTKTSGSFVASLRSIRHRRANSSTSGLSRTLRSSPSHRHPDPLP